MIISGNVSSLVEAKQIVLAAFLSFASFKNGSNAGALKPGL